MSYSVYLANQLEGRISTLERQLTEQSEQLRQKNEEIKALREALDQERTIANMLYHSIKAGHPIGSKRMNESLRTAEAWMENGRIP